MSKILLVEDDEKFADDLSVWLRREGHVVETVATGKDAIEWLKSYPYDAIILDWQLPDLDGVTVLRLYRLDGGRTPVLMLTGRAGIESKELGLDSGADDYLTKPPNFREVSARVRALLRRGTVDQATVLTAGPITVMPATRKVTRNGELIDLTPKEFALIEFLIRHKGIVFSAEELLNRVWSSDTDASSHTVRVCITRLRQKLFPKSIAPTIRTIYGVGYVLDEVR